MREKIVYAGCPARTKKPPLERSKTSRQSLAGPRNLVLGMASSGWPLYSHAAEFWLKIRACSCFLERKFTPLCSCRIICTELMCNTCTVWYSYCSKTRPKTTNILLVWHPHGMHVSPCRDAMFNGPAGITCGDDGKMYVVDRENHCVR